MGALGSCAPARNEVRRCGLAKPQRCPHLRRQRTVGDFLREERTLTVRMENGLPHTADPLRQVQHKRPCPQRPSIDCWTPGTVAVTPGRAGGRYGREPVGGERVCASKRAYDLTGNVTAVCPECGEAI